MRSLARAVAIAAGGTAAALVVLWLARPALTAFEWSLRERWAARSAPVSPALVIVVRDPSSEARFGRDLWDRAVLARVVTALRGADAAAVGIDVPLAGPSAPGRGGPSSDALLAHAAAAAGNVVYAMPPAGSSPPLGQAGGAVAHRLVVADADDVVRRVPLAVSVGGRRVPSLGGALAALTSPGLAPIPTDRAGRALVAYAAALPTTTFSEVWAAVERRDIRALRQLVAGKAVLLLLDPDEQTRRTPIGPLSAGLIHGHLLNMALTAAWQRELPLVWAGAEALALGTLSAWLFLTRRAGSATAAVALVAVGYVALLRASPAVASVWLPAFVPLAGILASSASAAVWRGVGSGRRVRRLENELARLRAAVVRQESAVEALDEDLEAARAAVARSAGAERELARDVDALRAELAEARQREERTRARLAELERELRVVDVDSRPLDDAAEERLRRRCEELGIVTRDPAMLAMFRDVERAARSTLPVLVVGEPGTGKELLARAVHRLSPRAGGPFVAVNMAAIPAELFESELFGHVKGAFTGAVGDRRGYFEQAGGGTIFLDEVGELRADHQAKLLRVLQERTFYRVGAARASTVDVRIVAASNRDLERGVAEGWFREDLYFRLKGVVFRLPPLRERRQDIAPLAARLLADAAAEAGRRVALSEAALAALERAEWPGNVRELQNCLRRAVALASGPLLHVEDLRLPAPSTPAAEPIDDAAVLACLRRHRFDIQTTAGAFGWDRSTVTQRLKGLAFRALVDAGGDRGKAALALAADPGLARTLEAKLAAYHDHLIRAASAFDTAEAAAAACRRRFKNLPERHFPAVELLIRQHFEQRTP
jgi:DNA-binding NtrC family response regulator/CHASE2 domain-containing sensor protein